jgi:hypothetical protein
MRIATLLLGVFALALMGLSILSPVPNTAAWHESGHTCAITAAQEGSNPSTSGIWAYDLWLTQEDAFNSTAYDPPSTAYSIKGVCLYTVDGDEFDLRYSGVTNVSSSDGCYLAQFYAPGVNEDGMFVSRVGEQPPCEPLSYMEVLIGGNPAIKQGDVNCGGSWRGAVTILDAVMISRASAGLEVFQEEPCPPIGMTWYGGKPLGDVDCSGAVNSIDTLKVFRAVSQLSVSQNEPCPDIGTDLPTS